MNRGDRVKVTFEAIYYTSRGDGNHEVKMDDGRLIFAPKAAKVELIVEERDYPPGTMIYNANTAKPLYIRTPQFWWYCGEGIGPLPGRRGWEDIKSILAYNNFSVVKP